jgi:acyl carrier protein
VPAAGSQEYETGGTIFVIGIIRRTYCVRQRNDLTYLSGQLTYATVDNLKEDLKKQIIEQLRLEEITPADINDDSPLFHSSGLGLDSIDALELIVMFEKYHGLEVLEPQESKRIFYSISSMANYIREKKAEKTV